MMVRKPCFVCGFEEPAISVEPISETVSIYRVECECGACGPHSEDLETAVGRWNDVLTTVVVAGRRFQLDIPPGATPQAVCHVLREVMDQGEDGCGDG